MRKLVIGDIELDSPVILAPMAGITNQAFKTIVRRLGAGLICTEMVNDRAVIHDNIRTKKMMEISEEEHPVAIQLFGNSVETMVEAAKIIDKETDCDIIDINMGCPAPKIVKNEAGSKILLDPEKVYEILSNVVKNVDKPVTVKMRIGWDAENINVLENAKMAEKAGVKAITIHGRTTEMFYTGKADWNIIKEVKKVVNIPVIGNGDITSPEFAKEMIELTGVDGIMVGRAALGNPWIFKQINDYLVTGTIQEEPKLDEKLAIACEHFELLLKIKSERVAVNEMRGHIAWYLKGIKGGNKYKRKMQEIVTKEDFYNGISIIRFELEE